MSTSATSAARRSGARGSWPLRLALTALGLLVFAAVAAYSTVFLGWVHGSEFDPATFKRRTFSYYEIPLIRLQVSAIKRSESREPLEKFLVNEELISVTAASGKDASARWDLIEAGGQTTTVHGDARILIRCFDAQDASGEQVWLAWSKEHRGLAKVLWPEVAKLARQQLYVLAPGLLELARDASDPAELQQQLDRDLAQRYLRLAAAQQQLGQHKQAVELYSSALAHAPNEIEALKGRAESLETLGKHEQAAADLAQVRQLQQRL